MSAIDSIRAAIDAIELVLGLLFIGSVAWMIWEGP